MGQPSPRSPFVYWSQDRRNVHLRVDINGAKNITTKLLDDGSGISFMAQNSEGWPYQFVLAFAHQVQDAKVSVKKSELKVELSVKKKEESMWQTVLDRSQHPTTPAWLKVDFDRWQLDDDESNDDEKGGPMRDYDYRNLIKYMDKDGKELGSGPEFMTKALKDKMNMMYNTYLCGYNICMFVAHFYVLFLLISGYTLHRSDGYLDYFWSAQSAGLVACTILQYMDVLHAAAGLVRSNWRIGALQVTGRLAVLWIINGNAEIHSWLPVYILMLVYFTGEQFRYPFYALSSLGISVRFLTWLRYSHFLVLYPLGFLMEFLIFLRSVPYYYRTERYGITVQSLALSANYVNFGSFLALFSVTIFPYVAFSLFRHMWIQRSKKLSAGGGRKKKVA